MTPDETSEALTLAIEQLRAIRERNAGPSSTASAPAAGEAVVMFTFSPADLPVVPIPVMAVVGIAVVMAGFVLMAVTVGVYRFSDTPVTRRGVLAFCGGAAALALGVTIGAVAERPAEEIEDKLYGSIVRDWLAQEYDLTVSDATAATLMEESDCGVPARDDDGDRCGAFFMSEISGERRHLAVHLNEEDGQYVVREIDGTLLPPVRT
jgi:hypothetical protein